MKNRDIKKFFGKIFSKEQIDTIAKKTNFKIRHSSKITPTYFLNICCFSNKNICKDSLEELSMQALIKEGISISPQGLDQRFNSSAVKFIKEIFSMLCKNSFSKSINNKGFREIFLMDSTEIRLPSRHSYKYKGSSNSHPSIIKINLLQELLNNSFSNLVLDDGIRSEHTFSKYIYDKLTINSLVLKDLGYFKFDDFKKIEEKGAYFISRLRAGTRLYKINPNPELKKDGTLKKGSKYICFKANELGHGMEVGEIREYEFLLGAEKTPYRIIIKKLDEETKNKKLKSIEAQDRRRKKEAKISKESAEISAYITNYYGLLKEEIIELYRLRWQIELMFKTFKSDFDLNKIKDVKLERIEIHIYVTLLRALILLELSKRHYYENFIELSTRRTLKNLKGLLEDFLYNLNHPIKFDNLLEKTSKKLFKKVKSPQL